MCCSWSEGAQDTPVQFSLSPPDHGPAVVEIIPERVSHLHPSKCKTTFIRKWILLATDVQVWTHSQMHDLISHGPVSHLSPVVFRE